MRAALVAAAAALGAACAKDVRARYPGRADLLGETATLELRFTRAVKNLHASVNGVPLTEGTHANRLVVAGIPPGATTVMLAADGFPGEKVFTVELKAGQRMVVPLSVPEEGFGRTILQTAMLAAAYVGYLAVRSAFWP